VRYFRLSMNGGSKIQIPRSKSQRSSKLQIPMAYSPPALSSGGGDGEEKTTARRFMVAMHIGEAVREPTAHHWRNPVGVVDLDASIPG
jgi:hypothetical protein